MQRRELGTTEEKRWRLKMRLSVDRNAAKLKCTVIGEGGVSFAFQSLGPEQTALRKRVLFGLVVSKPPGYGGRKDREGLTGWSQEGLLSFPFYPVWIPSYCMEPLPFRVALPCLLILSVNATPRNVIFLTS